MKTKTKVITFFLLFALLLLPTGNAYAQSPGGDVVRIGENYTLKSGETLDGSLVVIGGNVNIEKGAIAGNDIVVIGGNLILDGDAKGNVVVIGGSATASSKTSGDMVAIGGQISLTKTAFVGGNVVTIGGQLSQEPGAEIAGDIINNAPPITNTPSGPNVPNTPNVNVNINPFWQLVNVIGRALAVAAIGMLLSLFLQPQMERVADAITRQPLLAGSFGLLAIVVTPLAIIVMVVTLILIPVAIVVALLFPLAWLFGMVALGQEVGERFTQAINQTWAPVLSTGFGTFLFVLVSGLVGLVPCLGWLLSFIITLLALGGVAMTWFGTRSAPGPTPSTPVIPQVVEIPPAS